MRKRRLEGERLSRLKLTKIQTLGGKQSGKDALKRQARQVSKGSGKEGVESSGMECDSANYASMQRFYLRDEKTPGKENFLSEKRFKLRQLMDIEGINIVEVASKEWPHLDQ